MEIRRLDLPRCKVGEGPVRDIAEQALYYIDILERHVFRRNPVSGKHRLPSIDPSFPGRDPAEADGWCYVIEGLGVRGLPEPRYRG